jgi:hypothetical protein
VSWKGASPEAKRRAYATKNRGRRARYAYMRDALKAEPWKCREGQQSVLAMRAFFPDHDFPAELVTLGQPGPKSARR